MATSVGSPRSRRSALWAIVVLVVLVLAAVAAAVLVWSGATLAADSSALARVHLQPFAGTLEQASASGPDGKPLALVRRGDRLTPAAPVHPGETVTIDVVVRRPSWLGWALGRDRRERLTVTAPVARVADRWLTTDAGRSIPVRFDRDVVAVAYGRGASVRRAAHGRLLKVPSPSPAGSVEVAAAARSWETLGAPVRVSWFPRTSAGVALATPAPSSQVAPTAALRLTFSKPLADALGSATPRVLPATPGRWRKVDSHTLAFEPSGFGAPMGSRLTVVLPHALNVATASGQGLRRTTQVSWTVKPGSTLRLQQLLAQAGYLPVDWTPAGTDVPLTPRAQARAAVDPPAGRFSWRYPNTPHELTSLWRPGHPNEITRGAVMMFQDRHHLTVDSFAGPAVWHSLLADVLAHKRRGGGYSYVYVHRGVPQKLTLWHNGGVVLTSPGNTGVPAAPTQLGTFPVFEHIASGTMSGTNPDGSHYHDPGIRWISYFNGGEALHAFNRASFGTPQSLGCVELPLASAAKVWPYTPIGTLVTIEN